VGPKTGVPTPDFLKWLQEMTAQGWFSVECLEPGQISENSPPIAAEAGD